MKDVLLYEVLWQAKVHRVPFDVPFATAALAALALLPVEQRAPFFGVLGPALSHEDARVRALALDALCGADGRRALLAFVAALDDAAPSVRQAAVRALADVALRTPSRFAHVVFHPRADVRIASLDPLSNGRHAELCFFLLADPACRPKMDRVLAEDELRVPTPAYTTIVEFHRRQILSPLQAARLLSRVGAQRIVIEAHHTTARAAANVDVLVEERHPPPSSATMAHAVADEDGFDALFTVLLGAGDPSLQPFWRSLRASLAGRPHAVRRRAAASIRAAMLEHGDDATLTELGIACWPPLLLHSAISIEVRRVATRRLVDIRHPLPEMDDGALQAAYRELAFAGGELDLASAAGLVRLDRGYENLLAVVPTKALIAAMLVAPAVAATILTIADGSRRGRKWLLANIAAEDTAIHARILAWTAIHASADKLVFVEELEPWQAMGLATCLIAIERDETLKVNKVARLALLVGHCLTHEAQPEVVGQRLRVLAEELFRQDEPERHRFGCAMIEELARFLGGERFAVAMFALADAHLVALVSTLSHLSRLTYGAELALASVLADHPHEEVGGWARGRIPKAPAQRLPIPTGVVALTPTQMHKIATSSASALRRALEPWLRRRTKNLAEALARRQDAHPCVEACAALLGCHDHWDLVSAQFERFGERSSSFIDQLNRLAVRWEGASGLSWLGSAWLWRWERHAIAVARHMVGGAGQPLRVLDRALGLASGQLRSRVWRAIGEALCIWAARDEPQVHALIDDRDADAFVARVVEQLDSDVDEGAAKIFVGLYRARVVAAVAAVDRVKAKLPDVGERARIHLERVINARGLARRRGPPKRRAPPPQEVDLIAIRRSEDATALLQWCRSPSDAIVEEAVLRAIELGGEALDALATLILEDEAIPCLATVVESIALWPSHHALDRMRAAIDERGDPARRFRLAYAFAERGDTTCLRRSLEIASEGEEGASWFRPRDYVRLTQRLGERAVAIGLAASPQPHAYLPAVRHLLAGEGEEAVIAALRSFLLSGRNRLEDFRIQAATFLKRAGDNVGFPVLLAHACGDGSYGRLFRGLTPEHVDALVDAALMAGPRLISESRTLLLLEPVHVDAVARDRAYEQLLVDATLEPTAERIINILSRRRAHDGEGASVIHRIAEVFAWGMREGVALTRRRHRVHMSERASLGYTRMTQDAIWVSALPILRGDRHGKEIVEALILHEIGHHRHHREGDAQSIWKQAQEENPHGLLNLVADEHLERNLRALDASYGDRLKRLAAHAFRHAARDIRVADLIGMLRHESFDVLSAGGLGVSRQADAVHVESGVLLSRMERAGMSFARFMRALRMGLGNRYDDPRVAAALALFPKRFRHYEMAELLEVARTLRKMFGWESVLTHTYGGHETLEGSSRDATEHGRGIGDDEVQREVERVLHPGQRKVNDGRGGASGKLWINVSTDDGFEQIHTVRRVEPDRKRHREVARDVARHARTLRSFLERLGLSHAPMRMRTKGSHLDRSRLEALVLHRDPRVLVGRQVVRQTDLFVGVVVDCSGSMEGNDNIAKARRFACLVSEAVRSIRGVDARFFGFTDSVIYDAGDARRCGAASLETGGGNNDAAALHHVAMVAKRSRRKAKVVVMVSDGLPTECSTTALKALVQKVTRSGVCVAQVAVCPLEEVCFPHYVVLEGELDVSVRRFGQVVAKLVARAIA